MRQKALEATLALISQVGGPRPSLNGRATFMIARTSCMHLHRLAHPDGIITVAAEVHSRRHLADEGSPQRNEAVGLRRTFHHRSALMQ